MLSSTVLVFIFVFTFLHYYIKFCRRPARFPPGPPAIPVLGSLPFLRGKGIERFVGQYLKDFGDVVGFYVGSYPIVLLNDWKVAKDLFAKDVSAGRLENYTTKYARSVTGQNNGIVFLDGQRWSTQRSFSMKQLKNFGLTKKHLDSCILPQAKEAVQYLEEISAANDGNVTMDGTIFTVPVLNIIWNMMTGVSLDRTDQKMQTLLSDINFLFASNVFLTAMLFPWIRFFFPWWTGYNKRLVILKKARTNMLDVIREHKQTIDKEHPRDLIDAYLIEIEENGQNDSTFSEDQLVMVCVDLMAAGSETTSTTLLWIVEYMILYPEVQERCFQEIKSIIGDSDVNLVDMEGLHYCQATIAEVQRLAAVAVASIQHRLIEKTEVNGYVLPKDCLLLTNLQHFMTDPQYWNKPQQFMPDRFLNENGEFFKPDYFVPLGHGKRICMGESLAKAELSVFFVTLLQNLKFTSVPGRVPKLTDYTAGFTRIPLPYLVNVTRR